MAGNIEKAMEDTISAVETMDHLIDCPVDPFINSVDFRGDIPRMHAHLHCLCAFKDFLHSAEKSGFVLAAGQSIPTEPSEVHTFRAFEMVHAWGATRAELVVYMDNGLVIDYDIDQHLSNLSY